MAYVQRQCICNEWAYLKENDKLYQTPLKRDSAQEYLVIILLPPLSSGVYSCLDGKASSALGGLVLILPKSRLQING